MEKEKLAKFEKLDGKRRSVKFALFDKKRRQTQHQLSLLEETESTTDDQSEALHGLHRKLKAGDGGVERAGLQHRDGLTRTQAAA